MNTASNYCRNNLSSTIESGESYEDRFTDYIYDQNDYTLSNGNHVKVSTSFDYVYEDGSGNVYASNGHVQTFLYPPICDEVEIDFRSRSKSTGIV